MISFKDFEKNLAAIQSRIKSVCEDIGRNVSSIQLLPVTKRHPLEAIEYAIRAGLPAVGENRVQEASQKKSSLAANVRWELIGHLQTNKAKDAVATFDRIQSVDSLKLIHRLDHCAEQADTTVSILLQCNTGNDPNKYGFDENGAEPALEAALAAKNLKVDGLMTIAPLSDNPDVAKSAFEDLRDLRDRLAARCGVPLPMESSGRGTPHRAASRSRKSRRSSKADFATSGLSES